MKNTRAISVGTRGEKENDQADLLIKRQDKEKVYAVIKMPINSSFQDRSNTQEEDRSIIVKLTAPTKHWH